MFAASGTVRVSEKKRRALLVSTRIYENSSKGKRLIKMTYSVKNIRVAAEWHRDSSFAMNQQEKNSNSERHTQMNNDGAMTIGTDKRRKKPTKSRLAEFYSCHKEERYIVADKNPVDNNQYNSTTDDCTNYLPIVNPRLEAKQTHRVLATSKT